MGNKLLICTIVFTYLWVCLYAEDINGILNHTDNIIKTNVDILILGAGMSGIGAATALHEKHIKNFLVLEAKDYIGGRVKEGKIAGKTIPIGAGWIHSIEEDNHITYQLANKYKLKRINDTYAFDEISFRHGIFGYRFNKYYLRRCQMLVRSAITKCEEYVEKRHNPAISSRQCLEAVGWKKIDDNKEKLREAIEYFMFDFENGGTPDDLAAWQMSYTGEGKDQIVIDDRGYSYGFQQEIKPFRNKFVLNTEVQNVRKSNNRYIITTSTGRTYTAKQVVVTFSSNVLVAQHALFTPPLPLWKIESLKMVPLSHYCKMFFRFPYQFWEDDATYIVMATRVRGNYMHWQNFNLPNIFPGSNVLLATVTGETCKQKHYLSDKQVIKEAMKVLRIVYKKAPEPLEVVRSSWSTDPHVLGAYSLPRPGITGKTYASIAHPLHKSLWFTGEHANMNDFGYTHGAYNHGHMTAGKVIKCMLHRDCPPDRR